MRFGSLEAPTVGFTLHMASWVPRSKLLELSNLQANCLLSIPFYLVFDLGVLFCTNERMLVWLMSLVSETGQLYIHLVDSVIAGLLCCTHFNSAWGQWWTSRWSTLSGLHHQSPANLPTGIGNKFLSLFCNPLSRKYQCSVFNTLSFLLGIYRLVKHDDKLRNNGWWILNGDYSGFNTGF